MAYRFAGVEISNVTIENYQMELPASLAAQVEMFLPHRDLSTRVACNAICAT